MEEGRKARRAPLLVALVGIFLLAAVWATMAFAGGSAPAAKPVKAKVTPTQSAKAHGTFTGKSGREQCPFADHASNDL
ncbi:MAG TPA: hypothetical protein VM049_10025 [Gaiellaceae bacterium]|nr:hypothetical protein [Gaiellaceae bacterium]